MLFFFQLTKNKDIKSLSLNLQQRKNTRDAMETTALGQLNSYRASLELEPVTTETRKDNPLPGEDEHWNIVFHTEAAKILLDQSKWSSNMVTQRVTQAGH